MPVLPNALYADDPLRRGRQLAGDAAVLAWCLAWAWAGSALHDLVQRLGGPGERVERAGRDLQDRLGDAARTAEDVPLVGDRLAEPLRDAGGAGQRLVDAGRAQQEVVGDLATAVGLLCLVPALLVLAAHLLLRWRWVRASSAVRRLAADGDAVPLLAARAVAGQPVARLARLPAGTVGAWSRGDPAAAAVLASLELRGLGLAARGVAGGPPRGRGGSDDDEGERT
ncbi:hypothetical protein [Vallicoccus soli]|uniref:hypothetical protein n=1 Tax=Vallicoccus soli TaxID=2339232 RepID=UPI001C49A393|nr:hypothetical protein [Vallicoccus soli]